MNQEELNKAIAEKLMGLENFRKSECGKYWWHGNPKWPERTLNYFTEGWEQVEDKLAELGFVIESKFFVDAHKVTRVGCWLCSPKRSMMWRDTREAARYEAMKQAWEEILRRL